MVTVFGILNLTEDSFFDESRRLDPAGAVTAAIEMLRVGSDVVDVGPAASHPDARPVSPADEIRRIAPLLDALSDQRLCCKDWRQSEVGCRSAPIRRLLRNGG